MGYCSDVLSRPCDKWVDVDNGIALWQVLHDAREKDMKSKE
jgi:hypothetical protein